MSLLKFLLGSKFGQRKKWKDEEEQRKKSIAKVNLSDPDQRREIMNCIAFSPGIPGDDQRFVDIWEDDSLTISESSNVTIVSSPLSRSSENVTTVVEVHAEGSKTEEEEEESGHGGSIVEQDEEQEEIKLEQGNEKGEAEAEAAPEESNEVAEADEITLDEVKEEELDEDVDAEIKDQPIENADSDENEILNEENTEAEVLETVEEAPEQAGDKILTPAEGEPQLETSDSEVTEENTPPKSSTPDADAGQEKSDEEELPDQIVPELAGSDSTGSTRLTPTSSIEMETQTDRLPVPRETETQTDGPLPPAVSMRPDHVYKPCNAHEMRLLSVALSELEADMSKPPSRDCSCSGNQRPGPSNSNLSFSVEKNRDIARENANLLSRLQRANARSRKPSLPLGPPESSSSINRRKQQERIQRENLILLRKITAARGKSVSRGQTSLLSSYY